MLKRPVFPGLAAILVAMSVLIPRHQEPASLRHPTAGLRQSQELPHTRLVSNVGQILLADGFSGLPLGMNWIDGSHHGNWLDRYGGYGQVGVALVGSNAQSSAPKASSRPSETHAALVTSSRTFGNVDITLSMKTIKQLRTPRPNPWEMAWVLWHYTDDVHFYYVVLKTNGWELGKEDPAYPGAQRFLITRSSPRFKPGVWYSVHIRQVGRVITVWVGRTKLGAYWDRQRAYTSGSLGLYCEDSRVAFDNVRVVQA